MPSKPEKQPPAKHQLFIERQGSGEPVVLLHGLLGSHSYWEAVIKHIPGKKFEIITPDLLGFGRSSKPNHLTYSMDDHVAAIEESVLDTITGPITLVGHSMGALIALRLAAKHPGRIKKLVLINLPLFANQKLAERTVKSTLQPLQRAYVSRFGIILFKLRNNVLKAHITQSVQNAGTELPNDVVADYYMHSWQSFKGSLVNVVYGHSPHADLQNNTTEAKFIYSRDDPILSPSSLRHIDNLTRFERIELAGKHRLPIEQAQRIAAEICA